MYIGEIFPKGNATVVSSDSAVLPLFRLSAPFLDHPCLLLSLSAVHSLSLARMVHLLARDVSLGSQTVRKGYPAEVHCYNGSTLV